MLGYPRPSARPQQRHPDRSGIAYARHSARGSAAALIDRDVTRGPQIAQPEGDEVRTGGGDLVDLGFRWRTGPALASPERTFDVDQAATGT
jgi:hypothetical protein